MKTTYKIFVKGKDVSFEVDGGGEEHSAKETFKLLQKKFPISEDYVIFVFKTEETVKALITETW